MDSDFVKFGNIDFDCPNRTYYPGQTLSGNVQFQLTDRHRFSAITIQIVGQADVFWTEGDDNYRSTEEYFNWSKTIFGDEARSFTLPAGSHKVPFDFQLPFEIPSSLKENHGKIWYNVYAHAEFQGGQGRATIGRDFTVVTPFDLNANDINKTPIEMEFDKANNCCFYGNNALVRVQCNMSGFCPGQKIPLHVTVDNKSSIEIISVNLMLTSKTGYRCLNPETEYSSPTKVLRKVKIGPFLARTRMEKTVELLVPDMIAPNLEFCNIICVQYFIKVIIRYTGLNSDEENESEICIGSIPVEGTDDNYEHPLKEQLPLGPIPERPEEINIPVQHVPNENVPQGNVPYGNVPYGNVPYGNAPDAMGIGFVHETLSQIQQMLPNLMSGPDVKFNTSSSNVKVIYNNRPSAPPAPN